MAKPEYSTFTNGMEYAKIGEGNKRSNEDIRKIS